MKLLLLVATLIGLSDAKQLRASQEAVLSAKDHAFFEAHLGQHLEETLGTDAVGLKFRWEPPVFMLDDQAHGTALKTKVKVQVGMKKQKQGETALVDTASMNLDVEFGTSFIDHTNTPAIVPFLVVKVTLQPLAKMFAKGFAAMQVAMTGLAKLFPTSKIAYEAAAKATTFKDMAQKVQAKFGELKTKYPAMGAFLELIASKTEFGQGLGDTNQGFAWTYAHEDSEYKGRPSITFEWRPNAGSNSLTTVCAMVPKLPNSVGAKLGTCGPHTGLNFQMGLDECNLSGAFMKWILPNGLTHESVKDKPADKLPSLTKLKAVIKANFAAAKANPGLIKSFLNVVGQAIKASKLAFFAEIRFATFLAVKVNGEVPVTKIIGGEKN